MKLLSSLLYVNVLHAVISIPIPTNSSSRIVNGYEVDITEVPYQASLRRRASSGWNHMCGAVIVNNRTILTAAHCVESFQTNPSSLRVVVGTNSRRSGGKTYDVSKIIVHEAYSSDTLQNDIAIVVTAKVISFNNNIKPIEHAPSNFDLSDGTEAIVSGFGVTSHEGTVSQVLLATKVYIVNQRTCTYAYLRMARITDGMICAGASEPPRDACQGDSGGPLVSNNYLIGLVSWGEGCANVDYPGVYTRVSQYGSWIDSNLVNVYN